MKKKANFLFLISLIIGAAVGYVRSDIFLKHYDSFAGVILSSASLPIMLLSAFLLVFSLITFFKCRVIFKNARLSRRLTALDKMQISLGIVAILISVFYAFTSPDSGFFEKTFAVSSIIAAVYFVTALLSVRNTMTDLLSCASVLPAVFMLLSIYKTNIRFPNISLFAFEVLAALFLMLGFYYLAAMNFRHVGAAMPVWVGSLAVMFSLSSIVTHHLVVNNLLFEPVTSSFSIFYFIGAFLVLLGFSASPEAEKEEKLIYLGENGFLLSNGDSVIGFNTDKAEHSFVSGISDSGIIAAEDLLYEAEDFSVAGFILSDENDILGHHITTPNGKTLLNLTCAVDGNMDDKLIKKLANEYEKLDYLVVVPGEATAKLLKKLDGKLKYGKVITLSSDMQIIL